MSTSRYRSTSMLGKGAMGEVLRAEDVALEREVALKRIDPALRSNDRISRRFVAEARITARLDHPGIVPIYSLERDAEGELSYAMKLVRGVTLEQFLERARAVYRQGKRPVGELSLEGRLEVLLHVLDTMAYAHERGVLHRDLKPENVMVSTHGEVHVMDWGLARPIGSGAGGAGVDGPGGDVVASEGSVIGTPAFMSPEQAAGESDKLDARSDLFSLGLVLYEVVTLREARSGQTLDEVLRAAAAGRRNAIVHIRPGEPIARELVAIIRKATAPVRGDRYGSVDALAEDLRRFLRDESVTADPDRGSRRALRWIGRHRKATLLAIVGLILAAGTVVAVLRWQASEALRAREEAAHWRDLAVQALAAEVASQATAMNERLHALEGILREFATEATVALDARRPAPAVTPPLMYVYKDGRSDPANAPASASMSRVYGLPVSVDEVDLALAPGIERASVADLGVRLAGLLPALRRALLASGSDDVWRLDEAATRRLVVEVGLPLVWVYVATEEGVSVGFPGSWIYDTTPGSAAYDPRTTPWYRAAPRDIGRSTWLNSGVDENGLGLLVTCVRSLHDADGRFRGVAAIDLTLEHFIAQYLEIPALTARGAESFVVDEAGLVVVRSSDKSIAKDAKRYVPVPYPDEAVRTAIAGRAHGHLALSDGRLAVWAPVFSTRWTYLVVGAEEALLAPK